MPKGVHLPRTVKNCARCGREFTHPASDTDRRHCSLECARPSPHPVPTIECLWCKRTYQPSRNRPGKPRRFCSTSCGRRWFNTEKRQESQTIDRQSLREERKHRCDRCGWRKVPEVLEVHHKDRNRRHNTRDNLELLCPTCHAIDHFNSKDGQFKNNYGRPLKAKRPDPITGNSGL